MEVTISRSAIRMAWRPGGLIYLAVLLAGTAAGLWSEAIHPSQEAAVSSVLPTLKTLSIAQAMFILLVYPLVSLWRLEAEAPPFWPVMIGESAVCMLLSLPFYLVCGYLADATVTDVGRVAIYAGLLWPVGWIASRAVRLPRARAVMVLFVLLLTLGGPAIYYITLEFLNSAGASTVFHACPLTFLWELADARQASLWPRPVWASLLWPGAFIVGALAMISIRRA